MHPKKVEKMIHELELTRAKVLSRDALIRELQKELTETNHELVGATAKVEKLQKMIEAA